MTSAKRDFKDFASMGGEIVDNVYQFPTLFTTTESGKRSFWNIYIRLIKYNTEPPKHGYQWDLLADRVVVMRAEYLESKMPPNIIAQYWTESGIEGGKLKRNPPSYAKLRNEGRANERNTFQQALVETRAKWLTKESQGFSQDAKPAISKFYFPMLAKEYEGKVLKYPVAVQPKLNGVRCLAYCDKKQVVLYSRGRKLYPESVALQPIRQTISEICQEHLYFDGEFYVHGKSLQELNTVRREDNNMHIEYHVFDCFFENDLGIPFEERYNALERIIPKDTNVKLVPMSIIQSKKELDTHYSQSLKKKYEGVMIRNLNSKYVTGFKNSSKLRSKDLLKLKPVHSAEFEVVGFTSGKKGKEMKAVTWICATDEGQTFHVTQNAPYEEREEQLNQCQKNNGEGFLREFQGRLMTVEYRDLSEDGIPLQAKAIGFREAE